MGSFLFEEFVTSKEIIDRQGIEDFELNLVIAIGSSFIEDNSVV